MKYSIYSLIFIYAVMGASISHAEVLDESETYYDDERGERVAKGQHFSIAKDRQITKSGQYLEPEGLDKYFGRKIEKVFSLLEEVKERLSGMEGRLSAIENSIQRLSQKTTSLVSEEVAPAPES